ncbi:MAG: hypothetical protein HUJ31_19160 [Pseudomonadales bacterium]|nr:hypothetical protein [Pseudomonadales bacterium]
MQSSQPFPVEMVVFEEDTWMVMSSSNRIRDVPETTEASLQEIDSFSPRRPGELVVQGNRAFAIVHDFDNDPSFDPSAAMEVLGEIARLSNERGIESIAIQAMSAPDRDPQWFQAEIEGLSGTCNLERVWLIPG